MKNTTLSAVKKQYEDLPYPLRDPEDERTRLHATIGDNLAELNHWLYRGREDFKSGFRILIAGGGTGDAAIFLAEQLKDSNAEIVYLDFSQASMEIAQKRAEVRGLKNITWICDSILNIPKLNLGKFNFINCSGVLHHLASPDDGLRVLRDSLTETGGMHIMIYAKYGRTGLYHMQDIMKMVNAKCTDLYQEIMNNKIIMRSLPRTNWYVRAQELLQDHVMFGDPGLYDLFLHKQDRAYTIPEMYEFVKNADLCFVQFTHNDTKWTLKIEHYIKDTELLKTIQKMDIITQQAICELIVGNIIKHDFLVSKQPNSLAVLEDLNNVPYLFAAANTTSKNIYQACINGRIGTNITFNTVRGISLDIYNGQYTKYIFKYFDNVRSLREIFDAINKELKQNIIDEILIKATQKALVPLIDVGMLLLRDKSISKFTDYALMPQ